jgi:hypothetical protein
MSSSPAPTRCVSVADWLDVDPKTVSQWLIRYDNTPARDVEVYPACHNLPDRVWPDTAERRQAGPTGKASQPGRWPAKEEAS